jgi:TetR/AcrR family transcriptional regulator of autoinduction and epiphytic fitness
MATSSPAAASDRQQSLKNTHRRAIAEAAVFLAQQFGPGNFSADRLAAEAGVARRTLFNHFRSLDDAVYAGLSLILEEATSKVALALEAGAEPGGAGDLSVAFDDIAAALLGVDLVGPLCQIVRTIASREPDHPGTNQWVTSVLASIIPSLESAAAVRAPESRASSRALLVRVILAAVYVAFDEWYAETDAADDDASRVIWRERFDTALAPLRTGFSPTRS